MPKHASSTPGRPLIIGHRGAPGLRPEHTAASYRLAMESGVDAVEPDIVVTRDGVLAVRHENEIGGTTDVADRPEFADRRTKKTVDGQKIAGWFTEDFTWAELSTLRTRERLPELRPGNTAFDGQEPMLRLRDVLALVDEEEARTGRRVSVVVELKHPHYFEHEGHDLVGLLIAELTELGWDHRPGRLIIECFELAALERARAAGIDALFVFLLEHAGAPADEEHGRNRRDYEWYRSDAGLDFLVGRVDGISPAKRDILADADPRNGLVARAHARGLSVFAWTLRPENRFLERSCRVGGDHAAWGDWRSEWDRLAATGLDGVFVDHPELFTERSEAEDTKETEATEESKGATA